MYLGVFRWRTVVDFSDTLEKKYVMMNLEKIQVMSCKPYRQTFLSVQTIFFALVNNAIENCFLKKDRHLFIFFEKPSMGSGSHSLVAPMIKRYCSFSSYSELLGPNLERDLLVQATSWEYQIQRHAHLTLLKCKSCP